MCVSISLFRNQMFMLDYENLVDFFCFSLRATVIFSLINGVVHQVISLSINILFLKSDLSNYLFQVSMLGPSPDWIVGVSGLELCQKNCTWMESKELFLYPWDAGVDSGISYESPDQPTEPQQNITRQYVRASCGLQTTMGLSQKFHRNMQLRL